MAAQSPMIHFQGDSEGVTLRGSELKPKLDRFLNGKINELDEKGEIDKRKVAYIDKDRDALKYKVTIQGSEIRSSYLLSENKNGYTIVYGDRKKTILLRDFELTILCMNRVLQELIEKYLVEFFAVTNFGYMQNKGFGSFMPKEYVQDTKPDQIKKDVSKWLKKKCKAQNCYYMDFSWDNNYKKKGNAASYDFFFKEIKDFYDLLKTGRNLTTGRRPEGYSRAYIYQYMHLKGLDNEKLWMKTKGIAPALEKIEDGSRVIVENKKKDDIQNAKYMRALLGIGPKVEYLNACDGKNFSEKVLVKINAREKDIERMDSPIFFKIINNFVFICAERIPEKIYGKMFTFSGEVRRPKYAATQCDSLGIKNGKKGALPVPTENELKRIGFTIDDLLEHYVRYYNGEEAGEKKTERLRPAEKLLGIQPSYAIPRKLNGNKYVKKCEV